MSNSLHNKIYLGRRGAFGPRLVQRALLVGAIVGMAFAWLLVSG